MKGVAVRGINIGDVRALQVPIPSIQEQEEISRHVEFLFTLAGQLEARLNVARKIVVRLTPALLAKAFRGELVPQDPNDEPASVLLERIRTASNTRSAGSAASQRGRRKTRESSEQRSLVPTNDPSRVSLKPTVAQATQAENDLRLVSKSKLPDILKGKNLMQKRLIQVLEQHQAWIPASKACEELGISDGSSSDDLELFYNQLKEHVEGGLVVVQRRGDEDWLMLSSREVA